LNLVFLFFIEPALFCVSIVVGIKAIIPIYLIIEGIDGLKWVLLSKLQANKRKENAHQVSHK
jgi:hypothetical protein